MTKLHEDLTAVRYFDAIQQALQLSDDELAKLQENGFVVSDRLAFDKFKRAYAWIYWKDLPVMITTDSILHLIHYGYDSMLKWLEKGPLHDWLWNMLNDSRGYLRAMPAPEDNQVAGVHTEVDNYLTIGIELLTPPSRQWPPKEEEIRGDLPPEVYSLIKRIRSSSAEEKSWRKSSREMQERIKEMEAKGEISPRPARDWEVPPEPDLSIRNVTIFGVARPIDFSQFTPRGHYVEDTSGVMEVYFWAMMWLALIDFPLTQVSPDGSQRVQIKPMAAAHLLRDCIDGAGHRETWRKFDEVLRVLVGWSDNITLEGVDALIADLGMQSIAEYFTADAKTLTARLLGRDYGQSQIAGRVLKSLDAEHEQPAPMPLSFALMGQRFTLESWIMQELVFDHLVVDGERVRRAYPSPLDVMAALGNDRAKAHLWDEFAAYRYEKRLDALREQVDLTSYEFWENSFYNRWLNIIRALNQPDAASPPVMHSAVWADKTLHTQLASWTQLRHDNILFVKQPYAIEAVCEYPAGYVEPYPAFYRAVAEYAQFARQVFESLELKPVEPPTLPENATPEEWNYYSKKHRKSEHYQSYDSFIRYFSRLGETAHQLEIMAEKELHHELFTEEETLFLRSVVVRKYIGDPGYGGFVEEDWHGWYSDLVGYDQTPALIADLHTNTSPELGPVGVLHAATGFPAAEVVIVEHGDHQAAYVGPGFTYFEFVESGGGLRRLDDRDWQRICERPSGRAGLNSYYNSAPEAPAWVKSFRIISGDDPQYLKLPARAELNSDELAENDKAAPPHD